MREEPVSQRVTRTQASAAAFDPLSIRFEAAWQAGGVPHIEDYLGPAPGDGQMAEFRRRLFALVTIDLHYRWRSSPTETIASRAPTESTLDSIPPLPSRPRLEDYLRRYPALGPSAEWPESLILAEYQARHAYGDMPSHVEYRERFPAMAPRLDDLLAPAGESQADQSGWLLTPPSVEMLPVRAIGPDQFLANLVESQLFSMDEVAAIQEELASGEQPQDGRAFAKRLVAAGKLTRYQAEAICQGQAARLVLGEYVVLERLGAGGMGEVFKARHRTMRRLVALKILAPRLVHQPQALKRFHHEVQAAARLIHPNIVTAFDAGEQAGIHYLVMEYVDGQDLGRLLRDGPLPTAQAVDYILQAARGLDYAHRQGVIHRDIKPANLLLDRQGTVKILDMGLARMEETLAGEEARLERLTSTGQVMGTCDYMAPEQAEDTSQADERSDLYALGCSLYHLLTGRPPYRGKSFMQVLVAHREAPISSLHAERDDLPEPLERIYRRMVAKRPEERYQSAGELVADLEAFRDGTPGSLVRPPRASSARRRRILLAGLVGVIVGGLVLAIVMVISRDRASQGQRGSPSSPPQGSSAPSTQDRSVPISRPAPAQLSLVRQTLPIAPGEPLNPFTLVTTPASIPGVRSWTIEAWRHRGEVFDIAYSPEGTLLGSCGRDGTIRLWRRGLELAGMCVGQGADARALAWSPDGRYLASVGVNQQVRLWGVPGGEPISVLSSRSAKDSVAWSPDGTRLAVAGEGNEIELWDVVSGSFVKRLQGHANVVRHLAWSPEGRQLASCAGDKTIRLWDLASGGASRVVGKFADSAVRLAWSPSGLLLASITGDKVILQDPVDGIVRRTIRPEGTEPLTGLCWSPDGRALATSRRGRISVWDPQSGECLREFPEEQCTTDSMVAWAPNGRELAMAAEGSMQLWDPGTGQSLAAQEKQTGLVAPLPAGSPDGTTLALHPTKQRVLWDLASGRLSRSPASEKLVQGLCWSPEGKMLACSKNATRSAFTTRPSSGVWPSSCNTPRRSYPWTGRPTGGVLPRSMRSAGCRSGIRPINGV
jgi:serine/threonine protein kinase